MYIHVEYFLSICKTLRLKKNTGISAASSNLYVPLYSADLLLKSKLFNGKLNDFYCLSYTLDLLRKSNRPGVTLQYDRNVFTLTRIAIPWYKGNTVGSVIDHAFHDRYPDINLLIIHPED